MLGGEAGRQRKRMFGVCDYGPLALPHAMYPG